MISEPQMIAQFAMWGAALCYAVAASAYYIDGKHWMFLTMILYATTAITVWMAGTK